MRLRAGAPEPDSRVPEPDQPARETRADDPDALARELELELMQQRASWQKVSARRGTWRALSILFLLLLGLAAFLAYFYFVPELRSHASGKSPAPEEVDR